MRFPQAWPQSKLVPSDESSIIEGGDVAFPVHFTFFAACLRVARFPNLPDLPSKKATRFRAADRPCAHRTRRWVLQANPIRACKYLHPPLPPVSRIQLNFKRANFRDRQMRGSGPTVFHYQSSPRSRSAFIFPLSSSLRRGRGEETSAREIISRINSRTDSKVESFIN